MTRGIGAGDGAAHGLPVRTSQPSALANPNLRHVRVFIEIARRGSFRRAADALHMSEPAASQAMTQLEALLKVKLLNRTTRSVRLTEAGSAFFPDAERLVDGFDRAIIAVREFETSGRGRVTVACLSSVVFRLLPAALAEMKQRHPGVNVEFQDGNMRAVRQLLETGACDIAIVTEDASIRRADFTPLVSDAFHLVCSASHPLARKRIVLGQDLVDTRSVMLRSGSAIRTAIDKAFSEREIQLDQIHETTQVHTLLGLVEVGFGITVLPAMLCPSADNAAFAVRPLRQPTISRRIGLAFPVSQEISPAARELAEIIKRTVRASSQPMPPGVARIAARERIRSG